MGIIMLPGNAKIIGQNNWFPETAKQKCFMHVVLSCEWNRQLQYNRYSTTTMQSVKRETDASLEKRVTENI